MKNEQPVYAKSGTQNKVEGTARNLAGKVEESIGKAIGNPRLEAQGKADQLEGNAQKKVGETKKLFGE